jgi:glyceraldehyde 3-phosphate dehydrogenase
VTELTVRLARPVTTDEINAAYLEAASYGPMKGILRYTDEPIVLKDIVGDPASCILDSQCTMVLDEAKDMAKVVGWYDNEWGYSNRAVDAMELIGANL